MYQVEFTAMAIKEATILEKSDRQAYRKLSRLLIELTVNPFTGTGKPEKLKYRHNEWSRRITGKHRLIYSVNNETVIVNVLSVSKHYEDK
jgi:toxin YoeB